MDVFDIILVTTVNPCVAGSKPAAAAFRLSEISESLFFNLNYFQKSNNKNADAGFETK